jgi:integrase
VVQVSPLPFRSCTARTTHTTASLAISAGANVKVVQRLLGHARVAMTLDGYGHSLSDDLVGVADALAKGMERDCGITAVLENRYHGAGHYIRS